MDALLLVRTQPQPEQSHPRGQVLEIPVRLTGRVDRYAGDAGIRAVQVETPWDVLMWVQAAALLESDGSLLNPDDIEEMLSQR